MRKKGKNIHASQLARQRWARVPISERSAQVPRSGGRPRKYPKCPRYGSHRFSPTTGRCPCGFYRPRHREILLGRSAVRNRLYFINRSHDYTILVCRVCERTQPMRPELTKNRMAFKRDLAVVKKLWPGQI